MEATAAGVMLNFSARLLAFLAQLRPVWEIRIRRPGTHRSHRDGASLQLLVQSTAKGQYKSLGSGIEG